MISNELPKSLLDNPNLDQWLTFRPNGTAHLRAGKVEIGQGITTALVQIAAEELDLDPARLTLTAGDTAQAPDEGTTTGSMSIEISGTSIRLVCAEIRSLALQAAAQHLATDPTNLHIDDGTIHTPDGPTNHTYWTLNLPLARPATGTAPPKPRATHTIIGTNLPRRDLPLKLAGAGFLHDMTLPNMRHARMLHPPIQGAQLTSINESAITRTGATLFRQANFAALLADTEATATAALEAARPTWTNVPPLTPAMEEAAWLVGQPAIHSHFGTEGDAPPVSSDAPRIRATYSRPYISHGTLGPSIAIAHFTNTHLTIWSHSQGPYPLRRHATALTGLAEHQITVIHAQGAGCYGHNGADDAALEAALLALHHPDTPIRLAWTRTDEFAHEPVGTAMQIELAAALDAQGRPTDWTATIWSAPHVGRMFAANLLPFQAQLPPPPPPRMVDPDPTSGGGASRNAIPLYDVGPVHIDVHLVQRPPIRTSALRGLGALPNIFAIECFLDELADRAGADPVAYRLALLPDPRARALLQKAADLANWPARPQAGTGSGLGIALGRYKNKSAYAAVAVALDVDTEIHLRHIWCTVDAGLPINPDGIRNQVEGGIIQAASMTLKEQVRLAPTSIASTSWAAYPILRFSDIPPITTHLMDTADHPPLGVGECTMGPTAAAIGNAVAHALGTRIRALPLTRDRIAATLLAG